MRGTEKAARLAGLAALLCLLLVLLAAPAGARGPTASASIVGGRAAAIAEFPSLAYIQAIEAPKKGFACTGSVVAPRVVLTAGHCVEDIETGRLTPVADYRVATGTADLREVAPENVFEVKRALTYPGFDPGATRGDAGILILSRPTTAPSLLLAGAADAALLGPGTPVQIAGWGLERGGASKAPAALRATDTVVQSSAYCKHAASLFYPFYAPALQLCTTDPPAFASGGCFGDSGGPAIAHRADGSAVEIGVISSGGPNCRTTFPNVLTRVDRVSAWVAEWIAAVETGAAEPPVRVPKAEPPLLTIPKAKTLLAQTLDNDFGRRFARGLGTKVGCERLNRLRVKCGLAWFYGRNDYYGTVTVFYALLRSSVIWKARYTIRWVNDRCWFHSGRRASCRVHSRRR